jgi:hypothetical protein
MGLSVMFFVNFEQLEGAFYPCPVIDEVEGQISLAVIGI